MTNFVGNILNSTADAVAGVLVNFAGGVIAQLTDAIADNIAGNDGDDRIVAGNANDVITGGNGNDTINGRFGLDNMNGGTGIDTHDVRFFAGAYNWNMTTGVTNFAGETAINFEYALMGAGANIVSGNASANYIDGGAGNDRLTGLDGNDRLYGGTGDDTQDGGNGSDVVSGKDGIDTLAGANGNDFLYGGIGNDILRGSLGLDRFYFDTRPDPVANVDRIVDFLSVDDTIVLENAVFAVLPAGALNAAAFVLGAVAADATDRIIYDQVTGRVFYDPNGNAAGGQVLFAQLNAGVAANFTDFLVI